MPKEAENWDTTVEFAPLVSPETEEIYPPAPPPPPARSALLPLPPPPPPAITRKLIGTGTFGEFPTSIDLEELLAVLKVPANEIL
jgi:hypothetical protein